MLRNFLLNEITIINISRKIYLSTTNVLKYLRIIMFFKKHNLLEIRYVLLFENYQNKTGLSNNFTPVFALIAAILTNVVHMNNKWQ